MKLVLRRIFEKKMLSESKDKQNQLQQLNPASKKPLLPRMQTKVIDNTMAQ